MFFKDFAIKFQLQNVHEQHNDLPLSRSLYFVVNVPESTRKQRALVWNVSMTNFSASPSLYLYAWENPQILAWTKKHAFHFRHVLRFASYCRQHTEANRACSGDERLVRLCFYTPSFVWQDRCLF